MQCRGRSTASSARKPPIATNSKPNRAIAWTTCWRARPKSPTRSEGAGRQFVEIVVECHEIYGEDTHLSFLCGADAAERIATWDYGDPDAFSRMLQKFDLLVAERAGQFVLPQCRPLHLNCEHAHTSATEV